MKKISLKCLVLAIGALFLSETMVPAADSGVSSTERLDKAKQGDVEAQYDLGRMYIHGQGVPQDYSKAFEWFTKAADKEGCSRRVLCETSDSLPFAPSATDPHD